MGRRVRRGLLWTRPDADILVKRLWKRLEGVAAVGLTGSLLLADSGNDIDVIFYPLTTETGHDALCEAVRDALLAEGFHQTFCADSVQLHWAANGSRDDKHVEIWRGPLGRKLDAFILR